jgi:hypothetical protein
MGQSLHIVQLFYETIVTRVDLNSVEADGIVEAEVIFPNQYVWARYERPEWRRRSADDPLGKGVSLDFGPRRRNEGRPPRRFHPHGQTHVAVGLGH